MKKILLKNFCLGSVIGGNIFSFTSNAQIVYTNIKDLTYTCNNKCGKNCYSYVCSKSYALDLNNDGTADFNISAGREVHNYDGNDVYGDTYCCFNSFSNWVSIRPLNDNSVLVDNRVLIPTGSAVMAGSDISSVSAWSTGGDLYLRSISRNCLYYLGPCGTTIQRGDWPNSNDRYLGLKIILNGQTYYGWARLSVFVDESKALFKIMDYAYESIPDESIIAGNIGNVSVAKPTVNSSLEKNPNSSKLNFAPNPVSSSAIISFSLSIAGKVSLNLYDMTGRLVNTVTDKNYNGGVHQITFDAKELNAGIYLLRLESPESIETKKIVVLK